MISRPIRNLGAPSHARRGCLRSTTRRGRLRPGPPRRSARNARRARADRVYTGRRRVWRVRAQADRDRTVDLAVDVSFREPGTARGPGGRTGEPARQARRRRRGLRRARARLRAARGSASPAWSRRRRPRRPESSGAGAPMIRTRHRCGRGAGSPAGHPRSRRPRARRGRGRQNDADPPAGAQRVGGSRLRPVRRSGKLADVASRSLKRTVIPRRWSTPSARG